jgi:hypothetical protein
MSTFQAGHGFPRFPVHFCFGLQVFMCWVVYLRIFNCVCERWFMCELLFGLVLEHN